MRKVSRVTSEPETDVIIIASAHTESHIKPNIKIERNENLANSF